MPTDPFTEAEYDLLADALESFYAHAPVRRDEIRALPRGTPRSQHQRLEPDGQYRKGFWRRPASTTPEPRTRSTPTQHRRQYETGEPIMANDTTITVVGNLTVDPELKYTNSGAAWVRFTIASTPRRYDQQTGSWIDSEPLFVRCSAWRDHAERIVESLQKGMRVVATGRLKASTYKTDQGEDRTSWTLDVDEIGPSLRWATAKVAKATRSTTGDPYADEWSNATTTPPPATVGASSAPTGSYDEPPF